MVGKGGGEGWRGKAENYLNNNKNQKYLKNKINKDNGNHIANLFVSLALFSNMRIYLFIHFVSAMPRGTHFTE